MGAVSGAAFLQHKSIANKIGGCLRSPPCKLEKVFWQPRELQGATKRCSLPPQNCALFPARSTHREFAAFCGVLLWVQDDQSAWDSSPALPHWEPFPWTLLNIVSPDSSAGSDPLRKSCSTARRFGLSAVFPAKSSFPGL